MRTFWENICLGSDAGERGDADEKLLLQAEQGLDNSRVMALLPHKMEQRSEMVSKARD